jgi:hypothetical protein
MELLGLEKQTACACVKFTLLAAIVWTQWTV